MTVLPTTLARATLFDPPEAGDHGYGLFLSQHLVELYGGRLHLEATGPDGTVFRLRLESANAPDRPPRTDAETASLRGPERTAP